MQPRLFLLVVIGALGFFSITQAYHLAQVAETVVNEQAPPLPTPAPPALTPSSPMPVNEINEDYDEPLVSPQELKDVQRQIKDMKRDIGRLAKQAGKLGLQAEKSQLEQLNNLLNQTLSIISNSAASSSDLRDAIDEFHNDRHWDTLNGLRAKVELPSQIKDAERSLKNLVKLLKSKKTLRVVGLFGLDFNVVTGNVAGANQILQEVRNLLPSDPEEAQQVMSEYWENNPGEAEHAIHRFREAADMLRGIKDQNLVNQLKLLAQPAAAAFNGGDYREAIELLEEVGDDARRLLNNARRKVSLLNPFQFLGQLLSFFLPEPRPLAQVTESLDGDGQAAVDEGGLNQEEIQNILQYTGDNLKSYGDLLKRLNRAKLSGIEPHRAIVSEMLGQIKKTRDILMSTASSDEKGEAIDNYNQIDWSEIEEAGTAADIAEQLPKAMKVASQLFKLLDKFKPQLANLVGVDQNQLQTTVRDNVGIVNQVNSLVVSGNLPEAIDLVRQEGEGGFGTVETLYYQVGDLLSAARRLSKLKKFPAAAEQVRGILAPVLPDFYADPGGAGSLHQGDSDNPTVTDRIWKILDEAEERARRRDRKAASL